MNNEIERTKVLENVKKCIEYLKANALSDEVIWVGYGNRDNGKYLKSLRITETTVETSNTWGYRIYYEQLGEQPYDDLLKFLIEWEEIKARFIKEKEHIIHYRALQNKAIYEFQV